MNRPSTIVISDFLKTVRSGMWTPFEAATALKAALAKEGYLVAGANTAPDINVEKMRSALESIAGWRKVNISGEYEHGLRDIIRSITDCAAAALEASEHPSHNGGAAT